MLFHALRESFICQLRNMIGYWIVCAYFHRLEWLMVNSMTLLEPPNQDSSRPATPFSTGELLHAF